MTASPSTAPWLSVRPIPPWGDHPATGHRNAERGCRDHAQSARRAHPDDPGQRLGWQKAVGYGQRALGETAISRYKTVIGRGLRARTLPAQKTEARAGCSVL